MPNPSTLALVVSFLPLLAAAADGGMAPDGGAGPDVAGALARIKASQTTIEQADEAMKAAQAGLDTKGKNFAAAQVQLTKHGVVVGRHRELVAAAEKLAAAPVTKKTAAALLKLDKDEARITKESAQLAAAHQKLAGGGPAMDAGTSTDAGDPDAGVDAGVDAGTQDAGPPPMGAIDAGHVDAGPTPVAEAPKEKEASKCSAGGAALGGLLALAAALCRRRSWSAR